MMLRYISRSLFFLLNQSQKAFHISKKILLISFFWKFPKEVHKNVCSLYHLFDNQNNPPTFLIAKNVEFATRNHSLELDADSRTTCILGRMYFDLPFCVKSVKSVTPVVGNL
jgi:hypothetical protein